VEVDRFQVAFHRSGDRRLRMVRQSDRVKRQEKVQAFKMITSKCDCDVIGGAIR
jgi:hypothetical protein